MIGLASGGTTLHSFGVLPKETSAVKLARWKKLWTSCSGRTFGRFRPWGAAVTLMGANGRTFAMESATGEMRRATFGDDEAAKRWSCLHHSNERRREEPPPWFKCLGRPGCCGMLCSYAKSHVSTRAFSKYNCSSSIVCMWPIGCRGRAFGFDCRRGSSSVIAQG